MNKLGGFWNDFAKKNEEYQENNIFSDTYKGPQVLKKGDAGWGCPTGKTLERGLKAHNHITKEIQNLLDVMVSLALAEKNIDKNQGGRLFVTFKQIFDRYVRISDKVVGILMRARKKKLIAFEGEMLWQGQDDHVRIYILKEKVEKTDPKWLGRKSSAPAVVEAPKVIAAMATHEEEDLELPSPPKKLALCSDATLDSKLKSSASKLLSIDVDRTRKTSSPAKMMSTENLQILASPVEISTIQTKPETPVTQFKKALRQTQSSGPVKNAQIQPPSPQEMLMKQLSKESGPFKTISGKPIIPRKPSTQTISAVKKQDVGQTMQRSKNSSNSSVNDELMPSPELKLGIYGKVTRELRRNKFLNMMAIFTQNNVQNGKVKLF